MMPVAGRRHLEYRYVVSSTTERIRQVTGGQGEDEGWAEHWTEGRAPRA